MIRLQGKKVLAPIPTSKYKLYDKIVPIFTKGEYPDGRKSLDPGRLAIFGAVPGPTRTARSSPSRPPIG